MSWLLNFCGGLAGPDFRRDLFIRQTCDHPRHHLPFARREREANRAAAVIGRIRALLKKTSPITAPLDINAVIREVLALNRNELVGGDVRVQTKLAAAVPPCSAIVFSCSK